MSENVTNCMSTPRPETQSSKAECTIYEKHSPQVALSGPDIESNGVLPIDDTQHNQNGKYILF